MKKTVKSLLALTIIGAMLNSGAINAYAQMRTLTQANQIADQCYKGYNNGQWGPISITQGQLIKGSSNQKVYLITLSGTEFVKEQSTGVLTDLKSGFELNSPYLLRLIDHVNANIPKNSNLIIAGHSLGGMIAQQASGNSRIKDYYNILNVVTFGSPLINPFGREGEIRRLGDKSDKVPYLSAMGTLLLPQQIWGLNTEDGGYGNNFKGAHLDSYLRANLWGSYDVVGVKYGQAKLVCDLDTAKFYPAPTR